MHKNESGQALAFGAVLLVSLAIGMYLIADFGNHVRQKIHVQTVADAQAYSLANMEAQSFNFVAFCNRAQVTHYVTMMNVQALVSWGSWMEHGLAVSANIAYWLGKIPYLGALSSLASVMWTPVAPLGMALDSFYALQDKVETGLYTMNRVLWAAQMTLTNAVALNLMTGGYDILQKTKQDASWNPDMRANMLLSLWNIKQYRDAFAAAGGQPFGTWQPAMAHSNAYDQPATSETARLQRAMTEIVNGTRFDQTLVNRPPIPITGIIEANGWIQEGLNTPGVGTAMKAVFGFGGLKLASKSASRLVGPPKADWEKTLEQIFQSESADQGNRGNTMASYDEWLWGRGGVWASAGKKSGHCRAKKGVTLGESPVAIVKNLLVECRDENQDRNHNWKGIAPYMSLATMQDTAIVDKFHQPDVYVWLSKSSKEAGFGSGIKVDWQVGDQKLKMETAYGHSLPDELAPLGVHAIAHAQAYYHRPGNWQEPPNLWNPYWHARLMPVIPGLAWNGGDNPMETFLKNMMPALPTVYH